MTDYNDGNWHGWNGGECPVHPKSKIQWSRFTGIGTFGISYQGEGPAENAAWSSHGQDPHLSAFRVIKPYVDPPSPREWWSLWSPSGNLIGNFTKKSAEEKNVVHYQGKGEIIHVREVFE